MTGEQESDEETTDEADQNTHVERRNESGLPDQLGDPGEGSVDETDDPVPEDERETVEEAHEESMEEREEEELEPGEHENTEKKSTTAENQTNADNAPDEMPNQGPN
ncbi:hypothetical protein [Haloarchaeobius sp. DT45]|uniref:hypothetical protein n=1 Tax=Haloarchaeobius sp. DT45 TaxID=3446116 RepID=UPI003F6D3E70